MSLNNSLPEALKALRRPERKLALLLREGLESGYGIPLNRAYWAGKRRRIARRRL